MIKCKGCNEQIDYWPLARIKTERAHDFYTAGPALTHSGKPCTWFWNTRAAEIVEYILANGGRTLSPETVAKVQSVKDKIATFRDTPLPELATK